MAAAPAGTTHPVGIRLGLIGVLLTFATGSIDVACFLGLGHVFASVMTGNLVLLGMAAGTGDLVAAWHTGLALLAYAAGTLAGALLMQHLTRRISRGRALAIALGVELVPLAGFWARWVMGDLAAAAAVALPLAGVAMGIQSAAVLSLEEPRFATTYLTSTLTRLLASLVEVVRKGRGWSGHDTNAALRLAALVAGAAVTATLIGAAPALAPLVVVAPVLLATFAGLLATPGPTPQPGPGPRPTSR